MVTTTNIPESRRLYVKSMVERLKSGGMMEAMCVMSTSMRRRLGLCHGEIPQDRLLRRSVTCSKECFQDYRQIRRYMGIASKCPACKGSGKLTARARRKAAKKGVA